MPPWTPYVAIAVFYVSAIIWLNVSDRKNMRDGAWHPHVTIWRPTPVMRRWGGAWEHRAMTDEEMSEYNSYSAW